MRSLLFLSMLVLTNVFCGAQVAKPEDFSGLYSFVRSAETLQINVQPDHSVIGYVSVAANRESEELPLTSAGWQTVMFDKASIQGNHLEFKTKIVKGRWFEFHGQVERGKAKARDEEGYFVIRGTLTTVSVDVNGKPVQLAAEVEFQSFPDIGD